MGDEHKAKVEELAAKLKDLIEFYGPKYEQEMLKKMF